MYNLYILSESFTNGYLIETLDLFSLASILCGIFVIISKNPVISVLYLIALFLNISCYLIIIGLNFIALSYLLVYVGAVSILFLFILMLINVRISELVSNTSNSLVLAIIVGVYFNYIVYKVLPSNLSNINSYFVKLSYSDSSYIINNNLFNNILRYLNHNDKIVFVTGKT
jgi:NADH-ubiquinone oxidoreductase chain 6